MYFYFGFPFVSFLSSFKYFHNSGISLYTFVFICLLLYDFKDFKYFLLLSNFFKYFQILFLCHQILSYFIFSCILLYTVLAFSHFLLPFHTFLYFLTLFHTFSCVCYFIKFSLYLLLLNFFTFTLTLRTAQSFFRKYHLKT